MTQQLSDFTFAPDIAGLPFLNRSQTWGLITSIATPFCNVSRGFCSIFNSNVMQSNNLLFVWLMYNEDVLNDSILFRKNNPNWIVGLPPPIFLPQILPINRWWLTSIRLTVPKKKTKSLPFLTSRMLKRGRAHLPFFFFFFLFHPPFCFDVVV